MLHPETKGTIGKELAEKRYASTAEFNSTAAAKSFSLRSLSDSIRFVNKKINGGRLRDKDITKLQWLKMQERLTDLYLKGLKDYSDPSILRL